MHPGRVLGKVLVSLALVSLLPGCSFAMGLPTGKWMPETEDDCERLPWEAPVDAALAAAIFATLWWKTEEAVDACPPECDAQMGLGYVAAFIYAAPFVASSLESLTWERRCRGRFREGLQPLRPSSPPVPPAPERCSGWLGRLGAADSTEARERRFLEMPRECRAVFRQECAPHLGAQAEKTPPACIWLFGRK